MKSMSQTELRRRPALLERAQGRIVGIGRIDEDAVLDAYRRWAPIYDYTFGRIAREGRRHAVELINEGYGRVLEVGVGTGLSLPDYDRRLEIVGIDLSPDMLEKARERVARKGIRNVRLLEMDAADIKFADSTFDIVYAPYLISVVPDPVAVVKEMRRVCRPGGRIVILNHFRSAGRIASSLERMIAPFTLYLGFKSDLDLPAFLVQADLQPISIEKVNFPRIWSLVTCTKE